MSSLGAKRNSRMLTSEVHFALLFLLSASWLPTRASEPNCVNVADFDNCRGNALDFCQKGISCSCKDQMPFCQCPSYRTKWQNYWYMDPKCDQLWSTLDLIIICAVPAVALAAVVAVSLQWIRYCRSKPKKGGRRRSTRASQLRSQAQHIPEYVPNLADDPRYTLPQKAVKNAEAAPNVKFPRISLQHQTYEEVQPHPVRDFSYISRQPLRNATSGNGNAFGTQSPPVKPFTYWGSEIPDVDYEEENPFATVAMQQLTNLGTAAHPQPSYKSPQPVNYRNAERGGQSSAFGRPQGITRGF